MKYLKKSDPHIAKLIVAETKRQQETLDLIPSENIVSSAVREALGSALTNKYSEGYPNKRYYAGNAVIDDIELLAQERAKKVFRLGSEWSVNVQALSGSPANMAVYFALLKPGDTLLGMSRPFGGHLTHGDAVNFSGQIFKSVLYTVAHDGYLDYGEVHKLAKQHKPKLIVAGASAYSRIIDFEKFAKIAHEVGAYLLVDMSHISGLVVAGVHPSPFPHADVVMTTTHKTLRGPRGALIFSRNDKMIASRTKEGKEISITRAIDSAVFPGLQGGPHDNQTAAIAVALGEAMKPAFRVYGKQIVKNAKALAKNLQKLGFKIISGGTDNHLMLIDMTPLGMSGREAQDKLESVGIIVNRNTIPYDTRSAFDPSGIRIGTPSLTTRGMKEKEMALIAGFLHATVQGESIGTLKKQVLALCRKFPV
ncbi:MAG: serine hydroxymethyltransferase [bacterium]|nr:serine hydroxymethyltransferase [bacterium]MDZ4299630.1 serine hydroxymethyltransferase [Candidatus Sungbacteria bacterium]